MKTEKMKKSQSRSKLCGRHRHQYVGPPTRGSCRARVRREQKCCDRDGSDSSTDEKGNSSSTSQKRRGNLVLEKCLSGSEIQGDSEHPFLQK